jgi:hypothetical protein
MKDDIHNYIKNCKTCITSKHRQNHRESLIQTYTPIKPFEIIQIDLIGPKEISERGNVYALTLQCELTKYLVSVPIKNKKAETVAKALFEKFFLTYGNFQKVKTDLGKEFINEIFEEYTKLFEIEHLKFTAHRHQMLGSIERNHKEVNNYLRCFLTNDSIQNWDSYLSIYTFFYNIQPNVLTGYSPYELIFGKKPKLFDEINAVQALYNYDSYIKVLKHTLQKAHENTRKYFDEYKIKMKQNYDKNSNPIIVNKNDLVYIKNCNITSKFDKLYIGPGIVLDILDNNNVKIKINNKEKIVHKDLIYKI